MNRNTLLVLAAIVVLLGLAAWRQLATERRAAQAEDVALFEGVDPARVKRVRVENLARDLHLVFERDARGRWQIVEPTVAPAEQGLVQFLFQTALERRGTPVPASEARAEDLGLSPPRAIVEIEEDIGGTPRRSRIELGTVDLGGTQVNVRARELLLRTWRDLDTTLDRSLEDFMSHDAIEISPREVVEVHRKGSLAREPGAKPDDLTLDALVEDGVWRATAPVAAPLDPQAAALFVQGVASLHIQGYADLGRRLLADYGLDPPEMSLSLSTVSNATSNLRFGRPGHAAGQRWHCTLEGQAFVWLVEERVVELFCAPVDEFLDRSLFRFRTEDVDAVSLELEERELRLWRKKAQSRPGWDWKVAERVGRESAFTPELAAESGKVEDLIGHLARAEFEKLLDAGLAEGEARGSLTVQIGDDQQRGRFGADVVGDAGSRTVRFQRAGDSIAGVVVPDILELARAPVAAFASLLVVELLEIEQQELVLSHAGVEDRWVRGSKGLWTRPDAAVEARELRDVLDGILIVRAARHLADGPNEPLSDAVEVEFNGQNGAQTRYSVGRMPAAAEGQQIQIDVEGRRSVLKDQALHARLLAVVRRR